MTEVRKYDQQSAKDAEKVGEIFSKIEEMLQEAIALGASNQRMKLGLQYLYNKHTRRR